MARESDVPSPRESGVALSLAAAANHPQLSVVRRPLVAIIATGDELLLPGSVTGPDQIIASNAPGPSAWSTPTRERLLGGSASAAWSIPRAAAISRHRRDRAFP